MDEMRAAMDRLEARLDHQAGRIDALYELLELRGIVPRSVGTARGDAFDDPDTRDLCSVWKQRSRPTMRRSSRFHVGDATGV
jgi:hypothetical protein